MKISFLFPSNTHKTHKGPGDRALDLMPGASGRCELGSPRPSTLNPYPHGLVLPKSRHQKKTAHFKRVSEMCAEFNAESKKRSQ